MTQLNEKPITEKDVKEYLACTGDEFRLELQAYNICKTGGFESSHGGTYEDPVTKKTRQYDIRAALNRDDARIQLAIECKCLKESFPLLVYQTPQATDENYHEIVFSYRPTNIYSTVIDTYKTERCSGTNSFYKARKQAGSRRAVPRDRSADF